MQAWKWLFVGVAVWTGATTAAAFAAGRHTPRGEFVDIGGRKLRLVCEGPKSDRPTVWMEAGAYGLAADFAAIQEKLTAKGIRSCAYDRAGMGYSDPGPSPRDSAAIVSDLEQLIAASGERPPFILLAHSMAGIHVRLFAGRNPEKVAGLVLVEATTPEQVDQPAARRFISVFSGISRATAFAGSLGLTKPFFAMGDRIGLPPEGAKEKRRAFISGRHARTAAAEVLQWRQGAAQAAASGAYDPRWPVAVITAGPQTGGMQAFNKGRKLPAEQSVAGCYANVEAASHATLLGESYADAVVAGVQHVLHALAGQPTGADCLKP